jgi:alpha-beta hydrolase superfamily lysophospholipase
MNITTIVLIPGLWMTALCWEHWVKHFSDKGYCVIARSWPGIEGDIEQLRHDPGSLASLGVTKVVDHYEQIIRELETPPLIIGNGFGGLATQILLDRGWGAAGVAIASTPIKGILTLPTISMVGAILGDALDVLKDRKVTSLTAAQFHRRYANTLSESESRASFERYVVPGPTRLLLQTAFANFVPQAATSVNFRNNTRAPLLLVAAGQDLITPPSLVKANFDLYRESKAETDYKEFPDKSHFIIGEKDWDKVADYVLGWALCRTNGSKLTAVPNQTDSWSVQLST